MSREIRPAPRQAEFDKRPIPLTGQSLPRATRLCNPAYASQFYASRGSRLTPNSLKFSTVYLAASKETAVAELWGDRFAAQRAKGSDLFIIPAAEAAKSAYLDVDAVPPAKLCDLTDGNVLLAVGVDATTLTTIDLAVPQAWAECVANHPERFDGIRYFSRHTNEPCIALWLRPGGPDFANLLKFGAPMPFLDSTPAHAVAAKCGLRLSFAR
jgi:RES domain-containing protein